MSISFSHLVTRFFTAYLAHERGLSPNTIAAYSDCLRRFINYACSRFAVEPEQLALARLSEEVILDFLDHLEQDRKNGETTRNQRLAAIKTFFHFLARTVPELLALNERIQAIRPKKTDQVPPPSLTIAEVQAIIAAPDPRTLLGLRDQALLQTRYNTGARVQEIADLTRAELRGETPASVTLTGKGRKRRVVPLWPETVQLIHEYRRRREAAGIQSEQLFVNHLGQPLTRFGIGRRVEHHAQAAAARCPALRDRRVTPHVFRHTTALHLLEAGNDLTIVKEWLGHADLKTTSQYVEVSLERKRQALEKVAPPAAAARPPEPPRWRQPAILDFLSHLSKAARYVAKTVGHQPPSPRAPAAAAT